MSSNIHLEAIGRIVSPAIPSTRMGVGNVKTSTSRRQRVFAIATSGDTDRVIEVKSERPMSEFKLKGEVDEATMLARSNFPIGPEELIFKTRQFLAANQGCSNPELLADTFQFVAPVVGPLDKASYVEALTNFKLHEAFPDLDPGFHHFRVDPYDPSRVWFTSTARGTNTGYLAGVVPPSGKYVEAPPQALSCTFNEFGLVTKYTAGYVMDKEMGNTGGLGGVFGLVYAVNPGLLPFAEAQPWTPSVPYQIFQNTGGVISTLVRFISNPF